MNYFIKRDLQEYGPYTLAELQRYVASGNVLLTDLCRSEGMNDWVPVSQVIGNIPVPAAAPAWTCRLNEFSKQGPIVSHAIRCISAISSSSPASLACSPAAISASNRRWGPTC